MRAPFAPPLAPDFSCSFPDTYRLSRRAAYLTIGALSLSIWAGLGLLIAAAIR